MDFVLGALPFVRELLKDNTKVILSGNTLPALNDITHRELDDCLQRAKTHCPIIRTAIDQSRLIAMENGQRGPCLDLSNLDKGSSQYCIILFNYILLYAICVCHI